METNIESALLTASEAAKTLNVNRATVYKLLSSGRLPRPIKLGRSTRWRKDEMMAWIQAGCPVLEKWQEMFIAGKSA